MAPFDTGAESSIIGEGAAFLLLTRDEGGPAYCGIDSVETGNVFGGGLSLPDDALMILGADGRKELARRYLDTVLPVASAPFPIPAATTRSAAFLPEPTA